MASWDASMTLDRFIAGEENPKPCCCCLKACCCSFCSGDMAFQGELTPRVAASAGGTMTGAKKIRGSSMASSGKSGMSLLVSNRRTGALCCGASHGLTEELLKRSLVPLREVFLL